MVAAFIVPNELEAPAQARREIRTQLEGTVSEEEGQDVELLLSEVVTNAVRHSRAAITHAIAVRVEVDDQVIAVSVEDWGQGFVVPVSPQPRRGSDPQGFGLFLVDQLSASWGVDGSGAFRVWFRLERDGAVAASITCTNRSRITSWNSMRCWITAKPRPPSSNVFSTRVNPPRSRQTTRSSL